MILDRKNIGDFRIINKVLMCGDGGDLNWNLSHSLARSFACLDPRTAFFLQPTPWTSNLYCNIILWIVIECWHEAAAVIVYETKTTHTHENMKFEI